ncbi:class I SAM-dependent methyltransferase [Paenibacillaceae bacterium WGS1546]|uniref:class I SAM-dependent methyltransferase n=1 Tax=Cohnella sp. WGS1546 TaxID=3366810 RepID=UPI00372CEF79
MAKVLGSDQYNLMYWDEFYKKVDILEESSFCGFMKTKVDQNAIILDVGCGSGRDTFAFARAGYEVTGIDRSVAAIEKNNMLKEDSMNIRFEVVDIGEERSFQEIIQSLGRKALAEHKKFVVYARFVLHSINEETERSLLRLISQYLNRGDYFAAEFRTIEDQGLAKIYNDHYRRFIDAEGLLQELEQRYSFSKVYFTKGTGMSVYNDEDPFIGRVIVEKK